MKTERKPRCTREQVDEAAVWMTLLHSQDRSERTDQGFKRWLAAHPANAAAFEQVSIVHELSGAIPLKPLPPPNLLRDDADVASWRKGLVEPRTDGFRSWMFATAAAVVLVFGGFFFYSRMGGIETAVGEQRTLSLPDGSQVTLNTDTRIERHYDEGVRRVELVSGEALFEVAKDPSRPFVVTAGGRAITAIGTTFNIRRDNNQLAVTLIDGKVAVSSLTRLEDSAPSPASGRGVTVLEPGQRVTFARTTRLARLDRPALNKVTAWRSGRVEFDKVPLAQAINEINRYNTTKLSYEQPEAAVIPITGVFRAGSARSFAAAVAAAYNLEVREADDRLVLAGEPEARAPMELTGVEP